MSVTSTCCLDKTANGAIAKFEGHLAMLCLRINTLQSFRGFDEPHSVS